MSARIAVVIPSIGRDTLERAVESARWADQIYVLFDDNWRPVRGAWAYLPFDEPRKDWGHSQRNHALSVLSKDRWFTHVSFMDDDDRYTETAGEAIRKAVNEDPDAFHIFCMKRDMQVFGRYRKIEGGMVGTPMMVVPTHTFGWWGEGEYTGDLDFALSTAEKLPVSWHDDVICLIEDTV